MAALLLGIPYYTTRSNNLSSVKFLTNYYFPGMGWELAGREGFQCTGNAEKVFIQFVQGAENPLLFCEGFVSGSVNFISELQADQFECTVKYRYQQTEKKCMLKKTPDGCEVYFTQPQSGVAPGQVGVFYSGVECLGGAIIDYALKP